MPLSNCHRALVWWQVAIHSHLIYRGETGLDFFVQPNMNMLNQYLRLPETSEKALAFCLTYISTHAILQNPRRY